MTCGVIDQNEFSLKSNLAYQIILARVVYLRVTEPLPNTIEVCARYWKNHWCVPIGTEEEFIINYNKFTGEKK